MKHILSYVEMFYFDKYERKISHWVCENEFESAKAALLEASFCDGIGDVYCTFPDGLTVKLDYYNS